MQKAYNIDIANMVGLTAGIPDIKDAPRIKPMLDSFRKELATTVSLDRIKEMVNDLDSFVAVRPSVKALSNVLVSPPAMLQFITALERLWDISTQNEHEIKPQVVTGSRAERRMDDPVEKDAWESILKS